MISVPPGHSPCRLYHPTAGRLAGFFDVFAWRKPGEFWFAEAKVGNDRLGDNQRKFLELALRFHRPDQFAVIKIPRTRRAGPGRSLEERGARVAARRRVFRIDEMEEPVTELLLAGNKSLDTRSALHPLAMWLLPCHDCGVPKGEPCLPLAGDERDERATRNHYSHMTRRKAAAEHLSSLLCEQVVHEAAR